MLPKFWLYLALVMLATLFSQLAQFGHLKYASKFSLPQALAFALVFAGIEYGFGVPANRIGNEIGLSHSQLQAAYFGFMLVFYVFFIRRFYFHESITQRDFLGYILLGASVLVLIRD